jgi:tRNA threonylcarbamoyladenosine biosynthesis protein TsaE
MKIEKHITNSEEETINLGRRFAERLKPGDVVAIRGDLGSGKTEFIKGICEFFDVAEMVNSPTFTIINHYTGQNDNSDINIFHIDLYRINGDKELDEIGFEECIHSPDNIKLIEWPEKAENKLNTWNYKILIKTDNDDENKREIEIIEND